MTEKDKQEIIHGILGSDMLQGVVESIQFLREQSHVFQNEMQNLQKTVLEIQTIVLQNSKAMHKNTRLIEQNREMILGNKEDINSLQKEILLLRKDVMENKITLKNLDEKVTENGEKIDMLGRYMNQTILEVEQLK